MTEQIAVLDRHGIILMVNEAWERFGRENGSTKPTSFGVNYLEVCRRASVHAGQSCDEARQVLEGLRAVLEGTCDHFQQEYACHSPKERHWFVLTATPLTAVPGGAVVTHVDVTGGKLREQAILRQAHQDPLTGLANRRRIESHAVQVLAAARRSGRSAVVVAIDLDGFKAINDTYGHHAGDLALRQIAARLAAKTPSPGLLARLGGDEFAAFLPGMNAAEAEATVEAYRSAFLLPVSIEGREIRLGASIGFALYPEQGLSFSDLLRAADAAMYRVKTANAGKRSRKSESAGSDSQVPAQRAERWPGRGRSRRRGQRAGRWGRLATSRH
jgi:diguanylate cyclase (GGDEF)-like protein